MALHCKGIGSQSLSAGAHPLGSLGWDEPRRRMQLDKRYAKRGPYTAATRRCMQCHSCHQPNCHSLTFVFLHFSFPSGAPSAVWMAEQNVVSCQELIDRQIESIVVVCEAMLSCYLFYTLVYMLCARLFVVDKVAIEIRQLRRHLTLRANECTPVGRQTTHHAIRNTPEPLY